MAFVLTMLIALAIFFGLSIPGPWILEMAWNGSAPAMFHAPLVDYVTAWAFLWTVYVAGAAFHATVKH